MTHPNAHLSGPLPRSAALEISGREGSLALALGDKLLIEHRLAAHQRHAVELMPALEQCCRDQGWLGHTAMLDHLYLSLGPGSFTGLRIAVAIARTLAQAIGCKIVGVPSLDVLAQNAPADFPIVVPILDAKRGQIFSARYQRDAHGQLHRTAGPALVDPEPFLKQAAAPGEKIAILGEGIDYHRPALQAADEGRGLITELDRPLWHARAATVHRLAWERAKNSDFDDPRTLLPIYIRLPEAEEVWRKKRESR